MERSAGVFQHLGAEQTSLEVASSGRKGPFVQLHPFGKFWREADGLVLTRFEQDEFWPEGDSPILAARV